MDSTHLTLVPRENLARRLSEILAVHPLATLYGPPGSGKTNFLSCLVAYRNLTDELERCGKVVMLSLDAPTPDDPLRQLDTITYASGDARAQLRRLADQLRVDLPEPPMSATFEQRWEWIENPDDRRAPGLLLIDGCEQITDGADWAWIAERLIKPLVDGPTPICRVVCAQHRQIAWPLPELQAMTGELAMESFGEREIAQYIAGVLPIRSGVLAHLLVLCTAGFPLGLVAWQRMLRPPTPAAAPAGDTDDPRHWRTRLGAPLAPAPALLVAGAALLRSFDKSALQQIFAQGSPVGRALAERMGAPYAAALGQRPIESREYVRARQAMQDHGWLVAPDLNQESELVAPQARAQIYALLAIDADLAHEIDCTLATHYRAHIEADPFRAQVELIDWLYYTAGRQRLCDDEWAMADALFSLVCQRLRLVLNNNPFADLRVLGDLYTDRDVLQRLYDRGVYATVEQQFQRLVDMVSETLGSLRSEGLRLHDGQEIRDDRLLPSRNPLLRLSQKAFGGALQKIGASAQSWDLAVGPCFDAEEEFSRVWLQERDSELYDNLRRNGLIVGRSVNSLTPMIREMFKGDLTLAGRISRRSSP